MASRGEIHDQLVSRAQQDPDFRQQLLSNPAAALETQLGTSIPEGVNIRVVEESPQEVYVVLPAAPAQGGALSDDQLASVAGGASSGCSWGVTCAAGSLIGDC